MKLATLDTGGDGTLLIVSRDLTRAVKAEAATTLQAAMDDWPTVERALRAQSALLERGEAEGAFTLEAKALAAALPRGFQFLDASAFLAHNHILADAWGFEKRGENEPPLMYQGISHRYYSPHEPVPFGDPAHQIDLEGEIGIITDAVPMGVTPADALPHVRLIVMINDWSLRAFGPAEMRGGFGFLHAKPPSTLSAFAITPDELGDAWSDGRVHLPMNVWRDGEWFGSPRAEAMHFGFHDLIAHAAATRSLCAGTVIGSGTVSNYDAETKGSACISERRALDALAGKDATPFLGFGERVAMALVATDGTEPLGRLDQEIVRSR